VKIGNPLDLIRTGTSTSGLTSPDADKANAASTVPTATPDGSATVKLSGGMDSLKTGLGGDETFDAKRVEKLKAAIADGTFKVNAEIVADRLISGNVEALSRSKP